MKPPVRRDPQAGAIALACCALLAALLIVAAATHQTPTDQPTQHPTVQEDK